MLIIEILDWPWLTGIEAIQNFIAADIMKLTASTEQAHKVTSRTGTASSKQKASLLPCTLSSLTTISAWWEGIHLSKECEERAEALDPESIPGGGYAYAYMPSPFCSFLRQNAQSLPGFCHRGLYVSGVRAGIHWQRLCFQPWEMRLAQGSLPPSSWT